MYERTEDADLDGVIAVDPFALEALLELTGDVQVPGVGRVTADNIDAVVSNEAYRQFEGGQDANAERKKVLGGVAATALRRLLAGDVSVQAPQQQPPVRTSWRTRASTPATHS